MLEIRDLHVNVDDKPILRGINLTILPGEIHAIMGPNGSGKSTLANVLAGRDRFNVIKGSIIYQGEDLLAMPVDERAHKGVFLGFQYPVEIPGVSNVYLLKAAYNARRKARGLPEIDAMDFLKIVKEKMKFVEMGQDFLYRSVNEGFSGGEKKRNEILQMALLEPNFAVLDETDSGLDIDALRIIAEGVSALHTPDRAFLMITHYQRLLNYVVPHFVHVLANGQIIKSGDRQLAQELETKGYSWVVG